MRVEVKLAPESLTGIVPALDEAQPDYPLRISSFLASVLAHGGLIAALFTVSTLSSSPDRPVYDEFIKPHELKIIYYHFPPKVPDVKPIEKTSPRQDPRGVELSRQTIIATSPKPKSRELFVSNPVPVLDVTPDLSAPLLVAKLEAIAPPPEQPKRKRFVPPPPAKRDSPLPLQMQVLDNPSLPSLPTAPPPLVPTPTFSINAPPPKKAPEAPTAHSGDSTADIAVASLHPSDKPDAPLPNGERPAQFSKAPEQGPAASGGVNEATISVPNLTIRQPKPGVAPPSPTQPILYADIVRGIPQATLSAPLRVSSRSIPQAVDARFQGRDVYTIVIPIEHMPVYSGDWIMWFADRQTKQGQTPVVRAPMPIRKLEIVDHTPPAARTKTRIQLAGSLGKNGRIEGVTLLTQVSPAIQRAVLQDVTSWEFRPATTDGAPVDVDVVLEIPFSLPTALAQNP